MYILVRFNYVLFYSLHLLHLIKKIIPMSEVNLSEMSRHNKLFKVVMEL